MPKAGFYGKDHNVFPSAETLYATADKICESIRSGISTELLEERLKRDVSEEKLRHILSSGEVSIKIAPNKKTATITLNNRNISQQQKDQKIDEIYMALKEVVNV